jgi:hypothetical protein
MNFVDDALTFFDEGFNPLPLNENKSPKLPKNHNFLYSKINEIETRFIDCQKIGIACGLVSGGFYAVDFDCHDGQNIEPIFKSFCELPYIKVLFNSGFLSAYKTAGGGYHVYFKVNIALSPVFFAKWQDKSVMIEMRASGQYVVVSPSKGYNHVFGTELIKLQEVENSSIITDCLYSFNQYQEIFVKDSINNSSNKEWGKSWKTDTPDGHYNLEFGNEAKEMLIKSGWQYIESRNDGVEYWTRPNKDAKLGYSATWGHQKNMFYIFSQDGSIAPFEALKSYSPFNIYTLIKHDGDWKKAKDDLRKRFKMEDNENFWSVSQDGKYSLNNYKFKKFLEINDFFKNSPNELSTFDLIKKEGIFLKIVYEKDIKDFVMDFILENDIPEAVFNMVTGNLKYFKREYLSLINSKEIKTLKDTKDESFLFYKNCIVKVTKDKKETLNYSDCDLSIWKGQVINRDYHHVDHHNSEYRKFIWLIAGQDKKKYKAFQTVIGYLLHSYKTNSNNKAIIFNDEVISDNPNGRSGKGLFWNALKHLKKVSDIDGKTFDFNKSFPYQTVSTDCQILVFDDVKKSFNFENLFSLITEGITIEYKNKGSIKLPVSQSPKIIITTNYTISGDSASHVARKYEVEMSAYFNENYTPKDEFGHEFFNEWDENEWARFDAYMIECIRIYLENGLIDMPLKNLTIRKIYNEIGEEMYNFFDALELDKMYSSKDLYDRILLLYPEKKIRLSQHLITRNITKFCKYKNYELLSRRPGGVTHFVLRKNIDDEIPF